MEISLGLPRGVVATFTEEEIPDDELFCEELAISKSFEERRMIDFKRGRYCAHKCLGYYGINQAIGKDCDGMPVWPLGYVGSISHCPGLAGAIVARSTEYLSVGLDVEQIGRITPDLWSVLFTDKEIELIYKRPELVQPAFCTLIYAMKEAYYKMQFRLTGDGMEFNDLEVFECDGQLAIKVTNKSYTSINARAAQFDFKITNVFVVSYGLLPLSKS